MRMSTPMRRRFLPFLSVATLSLFAAACTTQETSHTIHDFTFSTSPHGQSWFTQDGLLKHDRKVDAFTHLNFDNLKQDMALGHGEYLASLGTLLGIPQNHHGDFFTLAQGQYTALAQADKATPSEFLVALDHTLVSSGIPTQSVAAK